MNHVKKMRLKLGLTKQALADRAGVHLNTITRIERELNPRLDVAIMVTRALGCEDVMFWIWGEPQESRPWEPGYKALPWNRVEPVAPVIY